MQQKSKQAGSIAAEDIEGPIAVAPDMQAEAENWREIAN